MNKERQKQPAPEDDQASSRHDTPTGDDDKPQRPREIGGRKGLDPTRFGDWEKAGRCIDF
ncbi:MAG: DUF1674 domain-containing protein [Woeseia sp.]|jgi:hypothetical protein